ncbi:RNA-binding cell elongation regulator Jag/EloR [Furfurilactobacillus entadae]|uniref:RNA-binding cell elongation regulator Jag/EloR n=1 Tax=Furfurilactobacillus entadae TaxID=2922307 RepID=UPI0035E968DD
MAQYRGKTVEDAIQTGLAKIQLDRDRVEIKVISEPITGWFGRLKQAAVVEISVKTGVQVTGNAHEDAAEVAGGSSHPAAPVDHPHKTTAPTNQKNAAVRDEELARDVTATAAVREREGAHPHASSHRAAAVTEPATPGEASGSLSSAELRARQEANQERLNANLEQVANYLLDVLAEIGVDADAEAETYHHGATITFMTEQEGLLIGRHGRTINALQVLGQTFMLRLGMQHFELMLDVSGYRDRRAATLRRLADATARDVIASGEDIRLDPMPSYERKVIHGQLAKNDHVTTFSQGREPRRSVVVTLR